MKPVFPRWTLLPVFAGVLFAAAAAWIVPTVKAQVTINTPIATSTTQTGSSVQLIANNPSRKSITICNASNSTAAAIAPIGITPIIGATGVGVQLAASTCFTPPAVSTSLPIVATAGWNSIGTNNASLIVLEWF
jgi:hypothetical protein